MIFIKETILFIRELILFIFPPMCPGCGKIDNLLCEKCAQKIVASPRIIDRNLTALTDYKNPIIKRALWLLKYHHKKGMAEIFGKILSEAILESLSENEAFSGLHETIVVPIPMSKRRLRERGYNHVIYICEYLVKNLEGVSLENKALKKTRETKRQALIKKRDERFKNMINSLSADTSLVSGKKVILIDDITTTGATIKEATRALKSSGAYDVIAYVIAH